MSDPGPNEEWDVPPTPAAVTMALAAGVAPIPFLAVYAVVFVVHGTVQPVHPPDVTSTRGGELIVGLVMLAVLIATITALIWLLNRRRRWPHALVQLVVLVASVAFLVRSTVGGRGVSALLVVTSLVSLLAVFAPAAWRHVRRSPPGALVRVYAALRIAR